MRNATPLPVYHHLTLTHTTHTHTRSPSLYPPLRKEGVEVEGGEEKGEAGGVGGGGRKRWRRGQIGALKFMAFFFIFPAENQ